MNDWISVNDKLPENIRSVLVWDSVDNDVFTGYYCKYNGWTVDGFYDVEYHFNVTHWMPLPEPPKED